MATFLNHTTGAREVLLINVPVHEDDSDAYGHYCILFGVGQSGSHTFHNNVKEVSTLTLDNLVKYIEKQYCKLVIN